MPELEGFQRLGKRGDNQAAAFAVVDNRLQSESPSTTKAYKPLSPRFVPLLAGANAPILPGPRQSFHIDGRMPLRRQAESIRLTVICWDLKPRPGPIVIAPALKTSETTYSTPIWGLQQGRRKLER